MNRIRLFLFLLMASASGLQASWRQRLGLQQPQQQFYSPMPQQQWQQPAGPQQTVQWAQSASSPYQQPQPSSQEWVQGAEDRRDDDRRDGRWKKEDEPRAPERYKDEDPEPEDARFAGLSKEQITEVTATAQRVSGPDPDFETFLDKYERYDGIGKMVLLCLLEAGESVGVKLRIDLKTKGSKGRVKYYSDRWVSLTKYAQSRGDDGVVSADMSRIIRLVVNQAAALAKAEDDDYLKASNAVDDLPPVPDWTFIANCNEKKITGLKERELEMYDKEKVSREAHDAIRLIIRSLNKSTTEKLKLDIFKSRASVEWFEKKWAGLTRGQCAALRPLISLILLFDEQFKSWQLNRFSHAARAEAEAKEDEESGDQGALAQERRSRRN